MIYVQDDIYTIIEDDKAIYHGKYPLEFALEYDQNLVEELQAQYNLVPREVQYEQETLTYYDDWMIHEYKNYMYFTPYENIHRIYKLRVDKPPSFDEILTGSKPNSKITLTKEDAEKIKSIMKPEWSGYFVGNLDPLIHDDYFQSIPNDGATLYNYSEYLPKKIPLTNQTSILQYLGWKKEDNYIVEPHLVKSARY